MTTVKGEGLPAQRNNNKNNNKKGCELQLFLILLKINYKVLNGSTESETDPLQWLEQEIFFTGSSHRAAEWILSSEFAVNS